MFYRYSLYIEDDCVLWADEATGEAPSTHIFPHNRGQICINCCLFTSFHTTCKHLIHWRDSSNWAGYLIVSYHGLIQYFWTYDVAFLMSNFYIFYKYSVRFSVLWGCTICLWILFVKIYFLKPEKKVMKGDAFIFCSSLLLQVMTLFKSSLTFVHVIIFTPI